MVEDPPFAISPLGKTGLLKKIKNVLNLIQKGKVMSFCVISYPFYLCAAVKTAIEQNDSLI